MIKSDNNLGAFPMASFGASGVERTDSEARGLLNLKRI